MDLITSRQNPKIKQARALRSRKGRERSGLFLVDGLHHLGAAQEAGVPLEYLLYAPEALTSPFGLELLAAAKARGLPCYPATPQVFAALSEKEGPAGLIGVARQRWTPLETLTPQSHPWLVGLAAPQDPGNLGAILRTLDAVGAHGLVLLDGGVDPFHPTAVRASMGAVFWVPVCAARAGEFAAWIGSRGYRLYAASAQGQTGYRALAYQLPAVLLMGSEREGLPANLLALCDEVIRVPMQGHVSSLNLAVATGVMLYAMHDAFPAKSGPDPPRNA
jgi:TrmH family RNA methyltransferase